MVLRTDSNFFGSLRSFPRGGGVAPGWILIRHAGPPAAMSNMVARRPGIADSSRRISGRRAVVATPGSCRGSRCQRFARVDDGPRPCPSLRDGGPTRPRCRCSVDECHTPPSSRQPQRSPPSFTHPTPGRGSRAVRTVCHELKKIRRFIADEVAGRSPGRRAGRGFC